ncbi:hypothetical protein EVAR_99951_1 [Eumeta japonica]|uniref:Uncharacterized protein n=1 Tax=Eumeta variegata TaxID=151549 RepID=A0A4C1ZLY6_EUMVA|nr:hypothetical protein EVAR_99951_1 [Eumeta japonica]
MLTIRPTGRGGRGGRRAARAVSEPPRRRRFWRQYFLLYRVYLAISFIVRFMYVPLYGISFETLSEQNIARERCGLKEECHYRVKKGILQWFAYQERTNERIGKGLPRNSYADQTERSAHYLPSGRGRSRGAKRQDRGRRNALKRVHAREPAPDGRLCCYVPVDGVSRQVSDLEHVPLRTGRSIMFLTTSICFFIGRFGMKEQQNNRTPFHFHGRRESRAARRPVRRLSGRRVRLWFISLRTKERRPCTGDSAGRYDLTLSAPHLDDLFDISKRTQKNFFTRRIGRSHNPGAGRGRGLRLGFDSEPDPAVSARLRDRPKAAILSRVRGCGAQENHKMKSAQMRWRLCKLFVSYARRLTETIIPSNFTGDGKKVYRDAYLLIRQKSGRLTSARAVAACGGCAARTDVTRARARTHAPASDGLSARTGGRARSGLPMTLRNYVT